MERAVPQNPETLATASGGVEDAWSSLSVAGLKSRQVLALRDSYADRSGAANKLMRALSSMMTWSIPQG
jgi:hypothetical protein